MKGVVALLFIKIAAFAEVFVCLTGSTTVSIREIFRLLVVLLAGRGLRKARRCFCLFCYKFLRKRGESVCRKISPCAAHQENMEIGLLLGMGGELGFSGVLFVFFSSSALFLSAGGKREQSWVFRIFVTKSFLLVLFFSLSALSAAHMGHGLFSLWCPISTAPALAVGFGNKRKRSKNFSRTAMGVLFFGRCLLDLAFDTSVVLRYNRWLFRSNQPIDIFCTVYSLEWVRGSHWHDDN